jgi:hypothetical protein
MAIPEDRAPLTAQVRLGQHVMTRDEEELGVVGKTTSKQFEVNPPDGGPYWLERQAIVAAEGREIVVGFPRRDLEKRRLKADEVDVTDGVTLSEIDTESAMSPEEKRQQREMVERDLTEQRERMARQHHAPGEDRSYGEPVESELRRLEDDDTGGTDRRRTRD